MSGSWPEMRCSLLERTLVPLMAVVAFAVGTHGCAPSGRLALLTCGTHGEQYRVLQKEAWSVEFHKVAFITVPDLIAYLQRDDTGEGNRIVVYSILDQYKDKSALPVLRERLGKTRSISEYRCCAWAVAECGGEPYETLMAQAPSLPECAWPEYVPMSRLSKAWWRERLLDFTDIFGIRLSAGPGLLVHGQVTKLAQAGLGGYYHTIRVGYKGRRGGVWREDDLEAGVSLAYLRGYEVDPRAANFQSGNGPMFGLDAGDMWDRRPFDVGAAVHVGIVGADVWFNPDQLIDFIFGFFNYHLVDDSTAWDGPGGSD